MSTESLDALPAQGGQSCQRGSTIHDNVIPGQIYAVPGLVVRDHDDIGRLVQEPLQGVGIGVHDLGYLIGPQGQADGH